MENKQDLVIVGGGITGLVAAYLASKSGKKVTVVEAGSSFGGLLQTFSTSSGTPLEAFYHHFFTHDAEINWLIEELGLSEKLVFKKSTMGVFRGGKIYPFNQPSDLFRFRPISWADKVKFGLSSLFLARWANWERYEKVSCMNWFSKWAGKTSTQALWKPMLDIKFGPFAEKVPLSWMIGRMRQRVNSRKQGEAKLGYLQGSLQTLLNALLEALEKQNVNLVANAPVDEVQVVNKQIQSIASGSSSWEAAQFLFTIPPKRLAHIFNDHPEVAAPLKQQEYFGAVCLILELDRPLSDVYWLNVADPEYPFGGVIEHTNFIPASGYGGHHLAYLSRYFDLNEDFAQLTEEEIKTLFLQKLPDIYPGFSTDWIHQTHLFRTRTAAPVCDLNFSQKVLPCDSFFDNAFHINMTHIYPDERSVNNSIRIASEACRVMGLKTPLVPKNLSLSGRIGFD